MRRGYPDFLVTIYCHKWQDFEEAGRNRNYQTVLFLLNVCRIGWSKMSKKSVVCGVKYVCGTDLHCCRPDQLS